MDQGAALVQAPPALPAVPVPERPPTDGGTTLGPKAHVDVYRTWGRGWL